MTKQTSKGVANTLFLFLSIGFLLAGIMFWFDSNSREYILPAFSVVTSALCFIFHKKVTRKE
jgi:hypothetical protein